MKIGRAMVPVASILLIYGTHFMIRTQVLLWFKGQVGSGIFTNLVQLMVGGWGETGSHPSCQKVRLNRDKKGDKKR